MTLTELLVGGTVGALVIAGAYAAFRGINKDQLQQQMIASTQSELLPLQRLLEKDIRRASQGMPAATIRRDSAGRSQPFYAIEMVKQARGASSLTLRGNFSGTASQLRVDAVKTATWLELQSDGARGFKSGDRVLLEAGENSEVTTLSEIDTVTSRLRAEARLLDFPAGASVIRIASVSYVREGMRLVYTDENGRQSTLSSHFNLMQVSMRTLNGSLDSLPPLDLANGQALAYTLAVKRKKPGTASDSIARTATGEVTLRNLML
jgi:hypothetical protein